MPLLSGAASITRLRLVGPAQTVDFDQQRFNPIVPESEVKESIGFLPFELGADYQTGAERLAFRVRIDRRRPDPTVVAERLRELIAVERQEHGIDFVPAPRRKALRSLAEEELLADARVQSQIVEAAIVGRTLYIATVSDNQIGKITNLLRKVGVATHLQTPWDDLGEGDAESEILELHDPTRSLHGSAFLQGLAEAEDPELIFEPHAGYLKLQTRDAKITVQGAVLRDLHHYLDEGCELLAAKLAGPDIQLKLDALTFRIAGASLTRARSGHWTERLDERLEQIEALWQLLDDKYRKIKRGTGRSGRRLSAERSATPTGADNVVPFG